MNKYRMCKLKSYYNNSGKDYDIVIKKTILRFNLSRKNRKQYIKDQVHFLLLFWRENIEDCIELKTLVKVSKLLQLDHSTVVYYVGKDNGGMTIKRKKSLYWEENIKEIKDFVLHLSSLQMIEDNKDFLNSI